MIGIWIGFWFIYNISTFHWSVPFYYHPRPRLILFLLLCHSPSWPIFSLFSISQKYSGFLWNWPYSLHLLLATVLLFLSSSCGGALVPFDSRSLVKISICNTNFDICLTCYWFIYLSCCQNYTMAPLVVENVLMCSWSTLDFSLNSSNMSLMLSSDIMFFSLKFTTLSKPNPPLLPCYTFYDLRIAPWSMTYRLPTSSMSDFTSQLIIFSLLNIQLE